MVRFIKFNNIVLRVNAIESISKSKTKKENNTVKGVVITMNSGVKYYGRDNTMLGLHRLIKQSNMLLGSGNLVRLSEESDITEDVCDRSA